MPHGVPLKRGIQRLTGITQAMVDDAPSLEDVLPELDRRLQGRIMVAHNAPFDRRVLRQAFDRIGLEWPDPPVICTARSPGRCCRCSPSAGSACWPTRSGSRSSWRIARWPTPRRARGCCARCFPGCAPTPAPSRTRWRCSSPSRPQPAQAATGARRSATRPPATAGPGRRTSPSLPTDPGVYIFRDDRGRVLYVGKSVSIRSRARAHFAPSSPPAAWTQHATVVDYRTTSSELGALVLENRLIKELKPPGNKRLTRTDDRLVYIRCRLDIPFPILEVSPDPAAGHAVTIGPVHGRRLALELVEQLDSLFGLRHCGRRLPRREHPSAYGQMGRCLSPCLGDLDPNLYRRRLDEVLAPVHDGDLRAGSRCLTTSTARCAPRPRSSATSGRRRCAGARATAEHDPRAARRRAGGHPRAPAAGAGAPSVTTRTAQRRSGWPAAGSSTTGRSPTPTSSASAPSARWRRAGRAGELGAHVPPDEIDEVRLIGSWLASHPDTPQLAAAGRRVRAPTRPGATSAAAQAANGSSTTTALICVGARRARVSRAAPRGAPAPARSGRATATRRRCPAGRRRGRRT